MTGFTMVLGGGGHAGTAFHAGVLTALARAGFDAREAEVLVGTSAGAMAAALIGAGFPPTEYAALIRAEPLSPAARAILTGLRRPPPAPAMPWPKPRPAAPRLLATALRHPRSVPPGIVLAALTPAGTVPIESVGVGTGPHFANWPRQAVWITAVELSTGKRAVFGRTHEASVGEAVAASVAIPGYFAPVMIDGIPYVDGGAWSTHNADLAAEAAADVVFVSAPASSDSWVPTPDNLRRIPKRRSLASEVAGLRAAGKVVVVFQPGRGLRNLVGLNSMSLPKQPAITLAAMGLATEIIRNSGVR